MQAHAAGAVNIQIYRLIKEWTAWDIARRAAFAFFGIFSGTEENPEFMQSRITFPIFLLLSTTISYLSVTKELSICYLSRCRIKFWQGCKDNSGMHNWGYNEAIPKST